MAASTGPTGVLEMRWTASPDEVEREISRLEAVEFFRLEEHNLAGGRFSVIGTVSHNRPFCGEESLRLRLEYPDDFPQGEPLVFDHEKVFVPSANGHQFQDGRLCLRFPEREEFSKDVNSLSREVIGAAWNWMVKRNVYERDKTKGWPGDAEAHGYAEPYGQLVLEQLIAANDSFLDVWAEWAIRARSPVQPHGPCPCLSGRSLTKCHTRIAELVNAAIYHSIREDPLNGRG
jgi:hypothetical protein